MADFHYTISKIGKLFTMKRINSNSKNITYEAIGKKPKVNTTS